MLLKEDQIREYVDASTFDKFKRFLNNNRVINDPYSRYCCNPQCSKEIKLKKKNQKLAKCEFCGTEVCT